MKPYLSIQSIIRKGNSEKDERFTISFLLQVGEMITEIPSGRYIKEKNWNHKKNLPKKGSHRSRLKRKFLKEKIKQFLLYIHNQEKLGAPITLDLAVKYFKPNHISLFSFWQEQIDLWSLTKAENTLKTYRSTLNVLKAFNPALDFHDLNYDCIQKFELYLRNVRGNGVGGAFTKQKTLKSMINQAIMKGHMSENPFKYFKIKAASGHREFLSIDEVKRLINLKISEKNGFLIRVRDLFLFSCFSGLRFSDVMNLKRGNIKQEPDRIEIQIQKTEKLLAIPLSMNAKSILEKYNRISPAGEDLPALPKMANPVINRELKVLMMKAGISKHISFHCARHSFASNLIENGTYMNHVKELLGHTSILQTQIYAKSLSADLYSTMDKLDQMYY